MKSIITLALTAALILAVLAGCTAAPAETTANGPKTLTPGTLTVGMEVGYPPMEYLAEDGVTYVGFDVDVATELAKRLGYKLEIKDTAWDAILTSLDSNRYDVIISALSITPDRTANYNLTRPYVANKLVLIVKPGSEITSPEDLAGKKVAVQTATTASDYIDAMIADGANITSFEYDKVISAFDELALDRADAVLVDSVVAAYYLVGRPNEFKTAWENDEAEPMALGLKKGNDELTAALEEAIDAMYADGTMSEIAKKNFGDQFSESVLKGTR